MTEDELLEYLEQIFIDKDSLTIGIYGHGASGKSRFAKKMYDKLGSKRANLLETDLYVISDKQVSDLVPKELPHQKITASMVARHELRSLQRDILALQKGMDILTIDSSWSPSHCLLGNKPILIVEGMSVAFLPKELFDVTLCFYANEGTELTRRLKRDSHERGRETNWIRETHKMRRFQYELYYKDYQKNADILIDTSQNKFIIRYKTI